MFETDKGIIDHNTRLRTGLRD